MTEEDQYLGVDHVDLSGDKWKNFNVFHKNLEEYFEFKGISPDVDNIPEFFIESTKIDWKKRIELQSVIQKYIDHSISSTINLPKGTSQEIVGELYFLAWECKLKGITVYVDGSRDGVLLKNSEKKYFISSHATKRPNIIECEIHRPTINGEKWICLIGLVDR